MDFFHSPQVKSRVTEENKNASTTDMLNTSKLASLYLKTIIWVNFLPTRFSFGFYALQDH